MSDQTSRRHILAALSGAAFAGGALVLAMPTEAPAAASIEPGADAELIRLCAQHIVNVNAYNADRTPEDDFDADEALWDTYEATRNRITEARPQTIEGMVAIARAAMAEAGPGKQKPDDRAYHGMDEHWAWNLVCDLLRLHHAAGRPAA